MRREEERKKGFQKTRKSKVKLKKKMNQRKKKQKKKRHQWIKAHNYHQGTISITTSVQWSYNFGLIFKPITRTKCIESLERTERKGKESLKHSTISKPSLWSSYIDQTLNNQYFKSLQLLSTSSAMSTQI